MRRFAIAAVVVLLVAPAQPSRALAGMAPTVLEGFVLDPVTGDGIAGATVVMGPVTTLTALDGSFRVETSRRRKTPFPTTISTDGYLPYRTWTEPAAVSAQTWYLFPAAPFTVPDEVAPLAAEALRSQFDILYRTRLVTPVSEAGEVLHRWVAQPEVSIVSHVMETVTDGRTTRWRVTPNRLDARALANARYLVRTYLPQLTGGRFSGKRVRVRKVKPGDELSNEYIDVAPLGELVIWVHDSSRATGGLYIADGPAIVSGAVLLDDRLLRAQPTSAYGRTVTHELGHALGMQHPPGGQYPAVPLCSIMGNYGCLDDIHVSATDVANARLAHSRLPGNDRGDQDPRPDADGTVQRPRQVVVFHGDEGSRR